MADFHCEPGSVRRVAVIGAGLSGLAAIKSCLEEELEPVCFERSSFIGGLWAPDKTNYGSVAVAYSSAIFNSSKEMSCFSDFPYPKSYPPYLGPKQQYEYLQSYADHFGLWDYIRFNTTVVSVSPTQQSSEEGPSEPSDHRWRISTRKTLAPGAFEDTEEVFDAVMICAGIHGAAQQPEYPGQDTFSGRITHSCHFRRGSDYEGQNVLVVGDRNSAGDVAVECSGSARKVFLSTRKGIIVLPRFVNGGVPLDVHANTLVGNWVPHFVRRWVLRHMLYSSYDPKNIGMAPPRLSHYPAFMVNDEIIQRIMYGLIKLKPSIEEFKLGKVFFNDGTSEEVDTVIFATGYSSEFPFVDDSILPDNLEDRSLYLHIFPTTTHRPTLAVIGIIGIAGATGPTFEMQTRCAVTVFKGLAHLPSKGVMERHIADARAEYLEQFGRIKPYVTLIPTMYELGKLTGCYPDFWRYILRGDFELASCLLFKPFFPYWMRLEGRHCWSGARQAIIEGMDNTFSATRSPASKTETRTGNWKVIIVLLLGGILALYQLGMVSLNGFLSKDNEPG